MNDDPLTIDEYEEEDLAAILKIENDSFPTPWSPGLFRTEMANPISRILVARIARKQGREVTGYVVFWRVADEIHLHHIAVRRDRRRRGIGSRLLNRVIGDSRAEGMHLMTLEVRRSNLAARKFYERFGCVVCGIRPGYYDDTREDALIMTVDLKTISGEAAPLPDQRGDRNENRA